MTTSFLVKWTVRESEILHVERLLPELARASRAEAGNAGYRVYRAVESPNVFMLHECYRDEAAAAAHRESDHYRRIVRDEILPRLAAREVTRVEEVLD